MNDKLLVGYNSEFLEQGIKIPIKWDIRKLPHGLIIGSTGTGKTMALSAMLGRIGKYFENSKIILCDFKADDFQYLQGCKNYYKFTDCKDGLKKFYQEFQEVQGSGRSEKGSQDSREFRCLVFDEWASFLNSCSDKKEMENYKSILQNLLMLGRSYNFHVIISQQRADATYFATARDNFSAIIMLGNISKESRAMFGVDKDDIAPVNQMGAGYILFNGAELVPLQVGNITDFDTMQQYIKLAVDR